MKIGLWGLRADSRGLAHQTLSYLEHLPFSRAMGFDLTVAGHSPYPCEWPNDKRIEITRMSQINEDMAKRWMRGLDVIFGAETFYHDDVPTWARDVGARTVIAANPEFYRWINPRYRNLPRPDVTTVPTTWLMNLMPGAIHLPFPIDRKRFPFKLRTQANHFVHPAGHFAMADRAGTRTVMGIIRTMPKGARLTIRTQSALGYESRLLDMCNFEVGNIPDSRDLTGDADVVLMPRRYGGQHLTINEALSQGIPCIMLDREPEKTWPVMHVKGKRRGRIRTQIGRLDYYEGSLQDLGAAIRTLHENPDLVERMSMVADRYANTISWDALYPRYMNLFQEITEGRCPQPA